MPVPAEPKIYHIVHVDRLPSIIAENGLWCDAEILRRPRDGTDIGMNRIKKRRLKSRLNSHPDLSVGDCVPFYFCPRSVMLYVIHQANQPGLSYYGGQRPIVHLEADLRGTIAWAQERKLRWAFTLSNAGASYSEDRCDLTRLDEINWDAVQAEKWSGDEIPASIKEGKQAEFLIERRFPWKLVSRIGVGSQPVYSQAIEALESAGHKPLVEIKPEWYY